ncbi:hypothetical protein F4779DRAFT_559427 [Xylariaceae sp. FL0662B]|nr:hypothetical protein F4779DRAFT_559427 [Xylariaceae sp. FL0662B]
MGKGTATTDYRLLPGPLAISGSQTPGIHISCLSTTYPPKTIPPSSDPRTLEGALKNRKGVLEALKLACKSSTVDPKPSIILAHQKSKEGVEYTFVIVKFHEAIYYNRKAGAAGAEDISKDIVVEAMRWIERQYSERGCREFWLPEKFELVCSGQVKNNEGEIIPDEKVGIVESWEATGYKPTSGLELKTWDWLPELKVHAESK